MSVLDVPAPHQEWAKAREIAEGIFSKRCKGKHFREAAKRLAKCSPMSYEESLDMLRESSVRAVTQTILAQMERDED